MTNIPRKEAKRARSVAVLPSLTGNKVQKTKRAKKKQHRDYRNQKINKRPSQKGI